MTASAQQLFERYIYGVMTFDVDAVAGMFADDGVYEMPLMPPEGTIPRQVQGPAAIRELRAELRDRPALHRTVNIERSRYQLHTTADPDVFMAEVDTAFDAGADVEILSLFYIFRMRAGKIALLREYFAPEVLA